MARLFIHIGWPKTGSTALQEYCHKNRARLAAQGLAYYASFGAASGSISRAVAKGETLDQERARFLDWAAQQSAPNVLVSAEEFAGHAPQALAPFLAPERWDAITVIGYLRRQEDYFEGWYKQLVKWGSKLPIERFLAPGAAIWRQGDYRPGLAAWSEWCARGDHDARFRIYDRQALAGGTLGSDFSAALGLPGVTLAPEARNVSPSAALIGLYLRLPPMHKLQQVNRAMVASGHPAATGSGDLLTAEMIAQIRATYATSNEAIRSRWFPERATLFDLPDISSRPQPATDGLADLLVETLARMRGPETASQARDALAMA